MEFHTDGNRMLPITCGHGIQAEVAEATEDDESVEDKEWCESLTQGHMPAGAFEISKKGPRYADPVALAVECGPKTLGVSRLPQALTAAADMHSLGTQGVLSAAHCSCRSACWLACWDL